MAAVFDEDLPSSEKLVLLAMADHADDAGGNCFPSIPRIARKASMTRRGVQKVLRRLKEKNKIRAVGHRADGTVEYAITLEGGERYSRGERSSRRTEDARGANQSAKGGERGSPESSVTVIEPSKEKEGAATQTVAPPLQIVPVILLPLNDGTEHPITQKEVEEWKQLYPAVDVMQALRSMRGWLLENRVNRKTKSGIGKFIVAWLNREQNNARPERVSFTDRAATERAQRNADASVGKFDPNRPVKEPTAEERADLERERINNERWDELENGTLVANSDTVKWAKEKQERLNRVTLPAQDPRPRWLKVFLERAEKTEQVTAA
jgi:hypothetical protein